KLTMQKSNVPKNAPDIIKPLEGSSRDFNLLVLVTDDDAITRMIMRKTLNRLGHGVDLAVDGIDCLEKMDTKTYDLLFIDNQMPRLSGKDTIERIRATGNDIPIISLSGTSDVYIRDRLLAAGANMVLSKPSSMQTIDRAIRNMPVHRN